MFQRPTLFLGQYRPTDSYLHRLDARAKLLPVLAVMILALVTTSVIFYLIVLAALVAGLLASGVGTAALLRNFRPVLFLVLLTALFHLIFTARDSRPLFDILGFAITEGGVSRAVYFSMRLLIFVTIAFLVTLTSSPSDLAESFTRLFRPLRKIRIPVDELGLILFMAIRFIPILVDEFTAIRNAQAVRGVNFTGSTIQRLRKSVYLLVPVFLAALARADDLAIAMEARGYRSGVERTFYSHARIGPEEIVFMCLTLAGIVAAYMLV
jgi:energy-coupling factor transport system permease protein